MSGQHQVTVDEDQVVREMLRYGEPDPTGYRGRGEYGPRPDGQPGQGEGPPPRPWKTVASWIAQGFKAGASNWPITPDEVEQLQADIEAVLDQHFPGGMSMADSWGPTPKLLMTLATIAFAHGIKFGDEGLQLIPPIVLEQPEEEPAGGATVGGDDPPEKSSSSSEEPQEPQQGARATIG